MILKFLKFYVIKTIIQLTKYYKNIISELNDNPFKSIKRNLLLFTNLKDPFTLKSKIRYLTKYQDSYAYSKEIFRDIKYFAVFVCSERSGHSLVGSILDAHPNMIFSHEADALSLLKYHEFNKTKVFSRILKNSYRLARNSARFETGYNYNISYKYPGKYTTLRVIGDKKGGYSSEFLYKSPEFLNLLLNKFGEKLKVINVLRNPYDNIVAMSYRNKYSITTAINHYFTRLLANCHVNEKLSKNQILNLTMNDMTK